MRRAGLIGLCLCAAAGCTSPAAPATATETCDAFVDAWTAYDVRCGLHGAPSSADPTEADRARVEADFFGATGCASAVDADFRDADALRGQCPPQLEGLACDAASLPPPCADQILR